MKSKNFNFTNTYPAAYMSTSRGHWTAWMTPIEFFPSVAISIVLSTRAVWTGAWMRVTGLITLWRPRTAPWPVAATVRHPSWTGMTPKKRVNLQQSRSCNIKININDKNMTYPNLTFKWWMLDLSNAACTPHGWMLNISNAVHVVSQLSWCLLEQET